MPEPSSPKPQVVGLHVQLTPEQHRWLKRQAAELPRGKVAHVIRALVDMAQDDDKLAQELRRRLEGLAARQPGEPAED